MSANAQSQGIPVTQEDINAAASAEQLALKESQLKYLLDRVVSLRVELNQFKRQVELAEARIEELTEQLPKDEGPSELDEAPVD